MKVDFFKSDCQKATIEIRFGLCDDNNEEPAYIDFDKEENWIATVINNNGKEILFMAFDNCVDALRENGDQDNRCDVILACERTLLFIELKTKRSNWKSEGLEQIEATIQRMIQDEEYYYYGFRKRKAIVANSKNAFPAFQEYDTEQREYFKKKYKIRLQFEAEITIA